MKITLQHVCDAAYVRIQTAQSDHSILLNPEMTVSASLQQHANQLRNKAARLLRDADLAALAAQEYRP